MDPTEAYLEGELLLEKLWREPTPDNLQCLSCLKSFTSGALMRTFRMVALDHEQTRYSSKVPTRHATILFFNRHFSCVVDNKIKFSAVSHVWDPSISVAQQQRKTVPQTEEAARKILDISFNIYNGVESSGEEAGEVWLDYLSVPQWCDTLRDNIISIMHELFYVAETTILHLGDISPESIQHLYSQSRTEERLNAVVKVCNSKYFSRIWTAMELIRSGRVRMMVGNGNYLADNDDAAFINRLYAVWVEETIHHGSVHVLEGKVEMGKNRVPWSLGLSSLRLAKSLRMVNFAMGSVLLCKRGCRDRMDFLHALRGIVVPVGHSSVGGSDFKTEYFRLAWECLKRHDMSPLLMTPYMGAIEVRGPGHWSEFANCDVFTWQLEHEISPPAFSEELRFDATNHLISLPLVEIGMVSIIRQPIHDLHPVHLSRFSNTAKLVLDIEGPDLQGFIAGMERTHGSSPPLIMDHLKETNQTDRLQQVLANLYNQAYRTRWPMDGKDGIEWLAGALDFSQPRPGAGQSVLGFNMAGDGTSHCHPYDYTFGITCISCHRTFAYRAGSFILPSDMRGAMAYRIPNLQYHLTQKNAVAVLVQGDRIVGRMIWAKPACPCGGVFLFSIVSGTIGRGANGLLVWNFSWKIMV
ncbi:uncharacterized protein B0J16DRAFT_357031 [Fusarium flagelliforme]|uniref:uncharacterized protein n=1 Tax=Fusarium flagelliforme TaxID=2675880 RepID=UPI001E8EBC0C|nr:uncharacterized protein B0J16DRAFT_357031 [Fusarium flagelliforme]KAH7183472.1 hypothetical protein B0J16DRAFT_357031 [Fusarium flagelliforme]